MEKLKNENLKKIEIKIIGDNCIVSYPSAKISKANEIPAFPQLDNELKSTIDLNLSLSSNSEEEYISNIKEIKRKKNDYESNSKKKLEITNKSIFYSESNLKISSSDRNIVKNNNKKDYKNKECLPKNSVIKKLNFDLCETIKALDRSKKLSESDRIKNKSNFLYKNKYSINNKNHMYDINNLIKNNNKNNCIKKRRNSMIYHLQIKKKESKNLNINTNQSFIRHRPNNSFVLQNPFNNNKFIYLNNNSSIKNNDDNKENITLNSKNSKPEINYSHNKKTNKYLKIYNKKRNIKNYLDKIVDGISIKKANNIKFKSTGNYSLSKIDSKQKISKKKESNNKKNNVKIKENKNNSNIKILNKNPKNMFCIKKPNKKKVPYLTSSIINNINSKNDKKYSNNNNNEYCSLKQYYHLKSPYLLNIQGSSITPITSTNGCTNYTNCTNNSSLNLNSPTTTKIYFNSNLEDKNLLKKYNSQNSFLKNMLQNNINCNNYINEKKRFESITNNKNIDNNDKSSKKFIKNNSNSFYKKSLNNKTLRPSKNSNFNKKLLNKCNKNELQNIIKIKIKSLNKILTERNIRSFYSNNSFNNNQDCLFEDNI